VVIILAQFNFIIHFRKQQKDAQNWTSFLLIFVGKYNQKLAKMRKNAPRVAIF